MVARGSERIADVLEELLVELPARLRGGKTRLSEQAVGMVRALVDELDLATRDEVDELELRVAQLEHRLRLLEEQPELPGPA
jgi:polyhydroxyalkanoate synthesis regulator phasin